MSVRTILILLVMLAASVGFAGNEQVNLAIAKDVKFSYLDNDGNELGAKYFNDTTGKMLIGGMDTEVVSSKYSSNEKKRMAVRFEFPVEIHPSSIDFNWMWGHNEMQWFDRAEVFVGNKAGNLPLVKTFNNRRIKQNSIPISIKLPPCKGRYVEIVFSQDANVKYFMMSFSCLRIMATASDLAQMNASSGDMLLSLVRQAPCNLFEYGKPATMPLELTAPKSGRATLKYTLRNYFGDIAEQQESSVTCKAGKNIFPITMEGLETGYYVLEVAAELNAAKRIYKAECQASMGVAGFRVRNMAEALAADCRFGIQGGFGCPESNDAMVKLGLNWQRSFVQFGPNVGKNPAQPFEDSDNFIKALVQDGSRIMMLEIKTFPADCYDVKRFGPMKGDWFINTVPVKAKYLEYIKKLVSRIPKEQKFFEIWNEPWDINPAEFAETAKMTEQAIRQARPDAIIGPNLGPIANLVKIIEYGGLDKMDMITIHPYAPDFKSSPEKAEIRQWVKAFKATVKKNLRRELDLYVTEIGWPTPKGGPIVNTEQEQAQYTVRACLELYAEGIKGIMPYCLGQPETDPNEKEHFFGFVRKNLEPKPVLLAYANLACMIEGSKYLGDLWLGPDIGAMLFCRNGINTLVVYTPGKPQKILLRPDAAAVTITDIMGARQTVSVKNNRLSLTLTGDPLYIVGVGDKLKALITDSTRQRWTDVYKREMRPAMPFTSPPQIDGDFSKWRNFPKVRIVDTAVSEKDASATLQIGYDRNFLYLALQVTDDDPGVNDREGAHVWDGDCLELFFSPLPENAIPGFLKENDYQLLIAPTSKSGNPVVVFGDVYRRGQEVKGVKTFFKKRPDGWDAEIALPLSAFAGAVGEKGRKWALEASLDDADKKRGRVQINSNGRGDNWSNSSVWSLLELK